MHLLQYICKNAICHLISEASMAEMSQSEGMCGSHLFVHPLLSDAFSRAFMRLCPLNVWRSHSRSHLSDATREARSEHFGRGYGSATYCHTSFWFCHTQLLFAVCGESTTKRFTAMICYTKQNHCQHILQISSYQFIACLL